MKITVMNKAKAEEYALQNHKEKSVVISIASHKCSEAFIIPNNISGIVDVIHLHFNDTDSKKLVDGGITEEDAIKIKNFVEKYKDIPSIDLMIVHCEAGQSRSAGVAAAIMKYLYNDDTQIFNNYKYRPNMLCYRTVLNKLMEDI